MGWGNKLLGWTSNIGAEVNVNNCLHIADIPLSGNYYAITAKTGTIAAAATAGSAVFAMRLNPGSTQKAFVTSIRLRWTTIAAFTTTPVNPTRSIVVTRGALAAATGGLVTGVAKKDNLYAASQFDPSTGGDVRVASTTALIISGITWDTANQVEVPLAHVGAAGAFYEVVHTLSASDHPIELNPGELLGIRVGSVAMDAGGTWMLAAHIEWRESSTEG